MKKHLLPETGNVYKANLHMHTVVSDGKMTPEETKAAYLAKGYSVVAFTDHEVLLPHNDLTDENFLAINSVEVAINRDDKNGFGFIKTYHLNLYSKDPNRVSYPFYAERYLFGNSKQYVAEEQKSVAFEREYSVEKINAMIAKANEEGFLVSYNHPVWSLQDFEDYGELKGFWGIELYNTGCVLMGMPDTEQPLDDLLRRGQRVFPLATDDAHGIDHCFYGYTMIKAERLEYGAIMDALEKGDFYASTGSEIVELYLEDNKVHVKCSPAKAVRLITERRWAARKTAGKEGLLTEAVFDLTDFFKQSELPDKPWEPWFRLTVTDAEGNLAWTRAYFADELK